MANALYPKYREARLQNGSQTNLSTSNVYCVLVDLADYTYSAAHEFLSDVPSGARVAVSANLGSKTFTNGTFDAADTSFSSVTGDVSEALIVVSAPTGSPTDANTRLIAFFDTGVTGLPVTPNGGNINVAFNASGIFG